MRLLLAIFFLLPLTCFAYDIKPYPEENGSAQSQRLKLVFCSLHYRDEEPFLQDIEALIARLNRTRPFDGFAAKIGFYYTVLPEREENLILKDRGGFPPLRPRQDFLDDISKHLKSGYKLVIVDASLGLACGELSGADKVSVIILGRVRYKDRDSFAKGFLHELGHSLGLRDEGLNKESARCLPGPPNCAVSEAEAKEWWGDLTGSIKRVRYIRGCCGNKDYIRPTIASLMNNPDKAEDFGPVNERYLKEVLEVKNKVKDE